MKLIIFVRKKTCCIDTGLISFSTVSDSSQRNQLPNTNIMDHVEQSKPTAKDYHSFYSRLVSCLSRNVSDADKMDNFDVIDEYEHHLQRALVTTSTFADIVKGSLDPKGRRNQLIVTLWLAVYLIPVYFGCYCSLYFMSEETRLYYQFWFADYFEQLGLFGRLMNFAYPIYCVAVVVDKIVLRKNESTGNLEFLTDMKSLKRDKKTEHDIRFIDEQKDDPLGITENDIDDEDREKLLSRMNRNMMAVRFVSRPLAASLVIYDLAAFLLFLVNVAQITEYPKRLSTWIVSFLALCRLLLVLVPIEAVVRHNFAICLSFVVTTDFFHARIDSLMKRVRNLNTCNAHNMEDILSRYDRLQQAFKRRNRTLKYLLRDIVNFFCVGLSIVFCMIFFNVPPLLRAVMLTTSSGWTICFFCSTLYVGQLKGRLMTVYREFNSIVAKAGRGKTSQKKKDRKTHNRIMLQSRKRLVLAMKELGSDEINGQFVMGLTDGEGPATSSLEIVGLIGETISVSLMCMKFVLKNRLDT